MQNSWIFLNVLISFLVHPKAQISLTIPILLGVPNMQIFLTLSLPAHTLLGDLILQKFLTVSRPPHTLLGVLNLLSLSLPTLLEVLNNQVFLYLHILLYQTVPSQKNKYSSDIHT